MVSVFTTVVFVTDTKARLAAFHAPNTLNRCGPLAAGWELGTAVADGCYHQMDEQTWADTSACLRDSSFPLDR